MEKNKFPNIINMNNPNDIRNAKKNTNSNEVFYPIQKQNIGKNISLEEMTIKNNGKMNRLVQPYQNNYELNKNINEEKLFPQNKIKSVNTIKETVIYNIKNKSKNRSMEKVPLSYKMTNNNERNKDFEPNQRKDRIKNVMEIGKRNKKSPNKHNSCGKNCSNYNKYNWGKNDLTFNDPDKLKQNLKNKSNRINKMKNNNIEFNNIDSLQNININQEKSKINNYMNYKLINNANINPNSNIITKSDLDDTDEDRHIPFKKYKSVCVSINNNYNYNVSLGNNSPGFIHQSFEDKNNIKNNKDIQRENEWKEKIIKINKQKREINYGDYRKLNSTDNNFWKRTKRNEINDNKNINKSSDDNSNFNVRQKIKKLNSSNIPSENRDKMNSSDSNIDDDKKNEPKKKMGILGFLRAFKDMVKPLNLRKKSNRNITEDENISKDDLNEKLNESDDYKKLDKAKTKNNFTDNNYSDIDKDRDRDNYFRPRLANNNNNNIDNKNDDYNYYSDSAYDSCPIPKNRNNFNMGNPNIYMNMIKNNKKDDYFNNPQILFQSQKNILKGNINNDFPNAYSEWNNESNSDLKNHGFNSHRGTKLAEGPIDNNLFNIYDIQNNKMYKKANDNFNNNNNYSNYSNEKYIIDPNNGNNFNSAYIKKAKRRIFSPNRNIYQNSINSQNELRKNSFLVRHNNYNINLDNNTKLNRQRIIEGSINDKYNSENINENLNINDEKKIQEIKININYKKNNNINYSINRNYNDSFNYDPRTPLNNQYMNIDKANNFYSDKKLFNTMNDFISTPKPKKEIETCIINFKQNKKQVKVYENNLNKKANNDNNNNNNNEDYIYNTDTNTNDFNRNNNSKNIYSKPYSKNLNLTQGNYSLSEKNIMNLKVDINNKNFDAPPIKRKGMLHKKEKIINRLADSQEFDNDTNSINSQNSQSSSTGNDSNNNDQLNKTALFPSSVITNSIYLNSFKSFFISNKNKSKNNSGANSFFKIFKSDNNDGSLSDRGSDKINAPGLSKSITNFNSNSNNNNKAIYISKKSNNLKDTNNNNISNSEKNIYVRKSSKNNNCKINSPINDNSAKNVVAINNITPMPDNSDYKSIINENAKINNIKTIIRPKVAQKKYNLSIKYYSYYLRNPNKENRDSFCSKENIKFLKLPLKQISFYTKYYYKIVQKPLIKQNYVDKKRIKNKQGLVLPKSDICNFTKKNIIVNDLNQIIKGNTNKDFNKKIVDENISHILNQNKDELRKEINNNNENKEINLDEELEEKVEIMEFEKNGKDTNNNAENNNKELYKEENLDINKGIKDYNNNIYYTPNLKTDKNNQALSPKFNASNGNNDSNSTKNKIICFEIDLNNKDKYIKKNNNDRDTNEENNLSSTYNNIRLNTNESLYVKKKPNNNKILNRNNNNLNYYSYTEGNKCKTNIREKIMNDNIINVKDFNEDDFNGKNYVNKSNNKIISIDIDLSKENKKIQKQKEAKEIKAYKKPPTLPPLTEFNPNKKAKINTIKINYNINNPNLNNSNNNGIINKKYSNDLNTDKLNEEIIFKLDSVTENNLMAIVDDLMNLLTKKVIIENINNNIKYNKVRLSFLEILNNESSFVEIIVNRAIYDTKKVEIYARVCYELSIKLTNEINFKGSNTEEDLKTILQEDCKIKFEEIILDKQCVEYNNKLLFGILMFICELINLKILALDVGFFCFEKLCKKFNESSYNNDGKRKYYFLNSIIDLINKYGKILYENKNIKFLEKIEKYVEEDLNNFINNDMALPEYLRNKIINLIKYQKNKWIF